MRKEIVNTSKAPAPIGPYNQAVKINGMLFVSGQIPIIPATGELENGGIRKETQQVMQNLQAILSEEGMNFENVVKCSIFVKNMGDFAAINDEYGKFFNADTAPARETVEVSELPKGVNVEISCIAVL